MVVFEIRLMFEWGGACLWGMNDAAKAEYGYAEIEKTLPLSSKVKLKLNELSERHDGALNWADPMGPSPWKNNDFQSFELEAQAILKAIQSELGEDYFVWYRRLGEA